MPRIRLLHSMNVADEHHVPGDEVDVDADVAEYLVNYSRAELVRGEAREQAVKAAPEKTATTTRSRKS